MAKKPAKPARKSPAKPKSRKPAAKKSAGANGRGSRKAAATLNGKPVRKKAPHGGAARQTASKPAGKKRGKPLAKKKLVLKHSDSKLKGAKPVAQTDAGAHWPSAARARRATTSAKTRPARARRMDKAASRAAAASPPGDWIAA